MTDEFKAECNTTDAPMVRDWIQHRGGLVLWHALDLGYRPMYAMAPQLDDDGSVLGPPSWRYGRPELITDEAAVGVRTDVLFATVPVKLVWKGASRILSEASMRKVDKTCERCFDQHGNARYSRKTDDPLEAMLDPEPAMLVTYSDGIMPLSEWSKHGPH
jgi:hypothetical protein